MRASCAVSGAGCGGVNANATGAMSQARGWCREVLLCPLKSRLQESSLLPRFLRFTSVKLSNNALNFLLAQYRAIFKHAYVKGLAAAVMLTAGLAAGQAQSAAIDTNLLSGTEPIAINGDDKALQITGPEDKEWHAAVTISSGHVGNGNYIQAHSGAINLEGSGSLTINVGSNAVSSNGLAVLGGIGSDEYSTNINIQSINVTKGTLGIYAGKSGSATVAADNISIGAASSTATQGTPDGIVTLSGSGASYGATLGDENSSITITKGGQLNLIAGASGKVEVAGQSLEVTNGGVLLVSDGADNTISVADLNVDKDSFLVIDSGSNGGTGVFSGKTADLYGNLLVASGATLDISTKLPESNSNDIAGQGVVTFADGSNTQIGGTVTINSGTVIVQDGAKLHASENKATINIKDAGNSNATLQIGSDTLTRFLTGKDTAGSGSTYTEIKADGTLGEANKATGASGSIVISGGRLELTSADSIVLSDYQFSGGASAQAKAGHIVIDTSKTSTSAANDLVIAKQLSGADNAKLNSTDSKLLIEAHDLTLGASDVDASAGVDYGFSGATTQNLTVVQSGTSGFVLKNAVTLDVTADGETVVEGESGTIKGAMTISGSLTAQRGTFSSTDDIIISGGTLAVKNGGEFGTGDAAQTIDTILKLEGDLTLQAGVASKIEIDGSEQGDHATILDIQDVNSFKVVSGASTAAEVNVKSGGTLVAKGEHLKTLLTDVTAAGQSGAKVFLNQGTISIVDDLTIDNATTKLVSGASATDDSVLTFHNTNGGTLEVANQLTLNEVSNLNIGAEGHIQAGILNLNGATDSAATLSSGNYTAITSLTSKNATLGVTAGEGANVNLGLIEGQGTNDDPFVAQGGGSLSTNLTIDKGAVTVVYGDWIGGKDITVKAGKLTVGDVAKTDAAGNTLKASLTLGALSIADGANTVVNETGTLNVNGLTSAGSNALSVTGDMTVKGQITKAADKQTITSYGLDIGADSIVVNKGGLLTFTGDAVEALKYTATSGTKGYFDAADSFKADGITLNAGGTVRFDFAEGTSFNTDALNELRTEVFNTAGGNVDGTISLGSGSIAGIEADTDGKYDWNDLEKISEFLPTFDLNFPLLFRLVACPAEGRRPS